MIVPELKLTYVMSEEWVDLEEFYVCLDAFIGDVESEGTEVYELLFIVHPIAVRLSLLFKSTRLLSRTDQGILSGHPSSDVPK